MRPQRPSADITRDKILQAALQLFMQHGFAGTAIGKIAEKADVNQTLIFHHFGNKKELWQRVKGEILDKARANPINHEPETLLQFLDEAITQRTQIYAECPKLKRLITWQKLESKESKNSMAGIKHHSISPLNWLESIKHLQKKKIIKSDLKPELIIIWIVASIDGLIYDDLGIFKNNLNNQQQYKKMLVEVFLKGLTVS